MTEKNTKGRDLHQEAKNRYARTMEAEAIVLDVYELLGAATGIVPDLAEYRKDLKTVLNLLAHYRHREIGSITGTLLAEKEAVINAQKSITVKEKVAEEVNTYEVEVPDEVADILAGYEVLVDGDGNMLDVTEKGEEKVEQPPVVKDAEKKWASTPPDKARRLKFVKKAKNKRK